MTLLQYVLNLGYNSECEVKNGYAFFFLFTPGEKTIMVDAHMFL